MCFFFIIGVTPRQRVVGEAVRYCSNCGRETRHIIIERRMWFNLFFIPLFPVSRPEMIEQCGECTLEHKPDSVQEPRLEWGQRAVRTCPGCGAALNADARFCHICGRKV